MAEYCPSCGTQLRTPDDHILRRCTACRLLATSPAEPQITLEKALDGVLDAIDRRRPPFPPYVEKVRAFAAALKDGG